MKKIIMLSLLSLMIVACKSKSATSTKLDNKTEVALKGNWTITSVTYPGSDVIKVTSFDIDDSRCMVGSTWKFVSNNNKGNMNLTKAGCAAFGSDITWFINKDGEFVMKILNEAKSRKVKEGYVLKVANITDNSFQLIDKINVTGKITDVVYQFARN
jgi:curli biogenesis system outer membrane secretion channel CsgG